MASALSNTVCGPLFSQLKQSRAKFHADLQASVNGLAGGQAFGMNWPKAWGGGTSKGLSGWTQAVKMSRNCEYLGEGSAVEEAIKTKWPGSQRHGQTYGVLP